MALSSGELLTIALMQLLLTALPGIASVLLAMRFKVRNAPVLLSIGLAGSGLTATLAFWAYFTSPTLGELFSYGILLVSVGTAIWSWPEVRHESELLRTLSTPLGLWVLGSLFMVYFGFLHGGIESPLSTASTRFSGQLPSDNDIPHYFAEWFAMNGHHGPPPPFPGDWLSSDRPPLQMGYMLSQRIFGWDTISLHYQVLGIVIQQLWIVGLWILLLASRVSERTRSLAIIAVLMSDVVIVNGFFVWPKLLAASFLLAAFALFVTPGEPIARREPWTIVLAGCLGALAYLAHGSSVFGLIPIVLIALYRGLPNWRWVAAGLLTATVLLGAWSGYQRYADPPGNRLPKWMLAGVKEIDHRGTTEAIVDSYSKAGAYGVLENKLDNFETMAGGGPEIAGEVAGVELSGAIADYSNAVSAIASGETNTAIAEVRDSRFFHLLPSLGVLLLGLPFLVVARVKGPIEGVEWQFGKLCLAFFALGAVFWGLLLFGSSPSQTIIPAGTLVLPIVGACGLVAGLRATVPRVAIWLVAASAISVLLLYTPSLTPPPGTSYSPTAAILALASLVGFARLALGPGVLNPYSYRREEA